MPRGLWRAPRQPKEPLIQSILPIRYVAPIGRWQGRSVTTFPTSDDLPPTWNWQDEELTWSPEQIQAMAERSGRTYDDQVDYLKIQAFQLRLHAGLLAQGHRYDGVFFDENNRLIVQGSDGSADLAAAAEMGLLVRTPEYGEQRLRGIVAAIVGTDADWAGVASVAPDIRRDRVVVTAFAELTPSFQAVLAPYGDAIILECGEAPTLPGT